MDAEKLGKAKAGLKACSVGIECPRGCPYEKMHLLVESGCIATMARDALEVIVELEKAASAMPEGEGDVMPAHIVPRELLMHTWGHGWEERHYRGDDEDPEGFDLIECVWINGHILTEDGCSAEADSDYWKEHYGKRYGVRLWAGNVEPTQEQREAVIWTD